jgi:hypothetical protein
MKWHSDAYLSDYIGDLYDNLQTCSVNSKVLYNGIPSWWLRVRTMSQPTDSLEHHWQMLEFHLWSKGMHKLKLAWDNWELKVK